MPAAGALPVKQLSAPHSRGWVVSDAQAVPAPCPQNRGLWGRQCSLEKEVVHSRKFMSPVQTLFILL